jgi:hypothetical protein
MAHVNREQFLRTLESVSPGLAAKEVVDQATCFVFTGGVVHTFNDEVAARAPVPVSFTGAIPAQALLDLLRKLTEDSLDIQATKGTEAAAGELQIKGAGRRSGITMEADVLLPFNVVEQPDKWHPVEPSVIEAIEMATQCAATEHEVFAFKCLHLTPTAVEACDNFKAIRYHCTIPLANPCLINASAGKHLVGYGMAEMCQTPNWLHFRNPSGLVISCRLYREDFGVPMDSLVGMQGTPARLPAGLVEAVDKATIFSESGDDVSLDLKAGKLRVRTRNASGWYEEYREVEYSGQPVSVLISAVLIKACLAHATDILICANAVKVERPNFTFFTTSKVPTPG